METLQGRVTHARHTTDTTGNSARTITQHIAIFEIEGVRVTFRGAQPVAVEPGDEVRVVGTLRGQGAMDALGYRNLTRGVVEDGIGRSGCAFGLMWLVFCGLAGAVIAALAAGESPVATARQIVPAWAWIAAAVLLVAAVVVDRNAAARRTRVLALLRG